jgi:hypothetical protein
MEELFFKVLINLSGCIDLLVATENPTKNFIPYNTVLMPKDTVVMKARSHVMNETYVMYTLQK